MKETLQSITQIKEIDALNSDAWKISRINPKKSFELSEISLSKALEIDYQEGAGDALLNRGASELWSSDYTDAITSCIQAQKYYDNLNVPSKIGQLNYTIGTVFFYLTDYDNALRSYIEALKSYEEDNNIFGIADANNGIGSVYYAIDENEKALRYLNKSLVLCNELGAFEIKQKVLDGLGKAYSNLKNYEKALDVLEECIQVIDSHNGSSHVKAHALNNIGTIHFLQENYDKALHYFNLSYELRKLSEFKSGMAACLTNIGKAHQVIGNYEQSEVSLKEALTLANNVKAKDVEANTLQALSNLFELTGNHKESLSYFKKFHNLHETIKNDNSGRRTKSIELNFRLEQEKSERTLLEEQNKNLQKYSNDLVKLSNIGKELTSILSIDKIIQKAYERINESLDAPTFGIGEYDKTTNEIVYLGYIENGINHKNVRIPLDNGVRLANICYKLNEEIVINNFDAEYKQWLGEQLTLVGEKTVSIIYVPFEIPGGTSGVITAQSFNANAYKRHHVNMLKSLSIYMFNALNNAKLYGDLERKVAERTEQIVEQKTSLEQSYQISSLLSEVGRQLTSSTNFNAIFLNLHKNVSELMDAECFGVRLFRPERGVIEYKFEIENGVVDKESFEVSYEDDNNYSVICIKNNQVILINDNLNEYSKYTKEIIVPAGDMPHSLIFHPMTIGERVIGLVTVQSFKKNAYSERHVEILNTLASFTAIALENVNLVDNLESKVQSRTQEINTQKEELLKTYQNAQLLNDVGRGITSSLSINEVLETMYSTINELIDASIIGISLYNEKTNELEIKGAMENGEKLPDFSFDASARDSLTVICFQDTVEIVINDFNRDIVKYLTQTKTTQKAGGRPESILYVPLVVKEKTIGTISVQSFNMNAYTDYHLNILRSLALYASTAIENASLYTGMEETVTIRTQEVVAQKEEIEKTYQNIKLLSKVGQDITSTYDLESIFEIMYEHVHQLMDATIFSIRICDWDKHEIHYKFTMEKGERLNQLVVSLDDIDNYTVWCAVNKKDIFINDHSIDYKKYTKKIVVVAGDLPDSLIFCPMIVKDKVIGVISAQSFKKNAYSEHHLDILRTMAAYAGIALENANLLNYMEDMVNKRTQEVISQKEIIEEKNKDITASIRYAQRIQNVILPSLSSFYSSFHDHFVLFKPRDIVSGDFYWLEVVDGKTYFAVVDCTGHGVPGALVSVVGANSLNRCLIEFGLRKPSDILDKLSELVTETFDKSDSEVKDGMDIALCCLDDEKGILEYAGANNPLWLLKNANGTIGKDLIPDLDKHQLIEIKPNKQPIGSYFKIEPFTNHSMKVEKGDIIYLFSDGFADQFGGLQEEIRNKGGKKFKYSKLKELIYESQHLTMKDQIGVFNSRFEEWKGELDQVDDVCIVGIQL